MGFDEQERGDVTWIDWQKRRINTYKSQPHWILHMWTRKDDCERDGFIWNTDHFFSFVFFSLPHQLWIKPIYLENFFLVRPPRIRVDRNGKRMLFHTKVMIFKFSPGFSHDFSMVFPYLPWFPHGFRGVKTRPGSVSSCQCLGRGPCWTRNTWNGPTSSKAPWRPRSMGGPCAWRLGSCRSGWVGVGVVGGIWRLKGWGKRLEKGWLKPGLCSMTHGWTGDFSKHGGNRGVEATKDGDFMVLEAWNLEFRQKWWNNAGFKIA